jgi:hypothetical protein
VEDFWADLILRLGFPVVVVLAMIKGYLVPGFIYQRAIDEADRLTRLAEEKLYPITAESQATLKEALELIRDMREELEPPAPPPRKRAARTTR